LPSLLTRLRDTIARRFFVALRRATHRMPSRLLCVRKERVLVVAPHLDDEAVACGGTLLLHRRAGSEVHVVFTSDSTSGIANAHCRSLMRSTREREALAAKSVLDYQSSEILGFPDGTLFQHEQPMRERLRVAIRDFRPTQILSPFPADSHGDHQATAHATALAACDADFDGEIWAYEVWTTLWPNTFIDISAVGNEKARAIDCYTSQLANRDYVGATMGLNRYRGLRHKLDLAEAFYTCSAPAFLDFTSALDRM
jgi:N-acetylglucosamine malate deacetylase 1